MDADTVRALRDAKALLDEGILTEAEFAAKKAELLQPKKQETKPELVIEQKPKLLIQEAKDSVLVRGPGSFKAKPKLKELGGTWNKAVQAWVFSKPLDEVVAGLSDFEVKVGKPEVEVKPYKKSVVVTGDTIHVKDKLKALGGKWNPTLQGWVFSQKVQDRVVAELQKDVEIKVEEPPQKKAKIEGDEATPLPPDACAELPEAT